MTRVFNFSAGPAALPEAVLTRARDEMLDWQGLGVSVMEISHRSKAFLQLAEKTEADLRSLLEIPDSHAVLFLQGGATGQFAMVPMNLCGSSSHAAYVSTGAWSEKAITEARRFCEVTVAASSRESDFTEIPAVADWQVPEDCVYLHYTSNETIGGVEFQEAPGIAAPVLVSDMSSNILSRPVDVARHGLIYAGAQKNMGPSGITVAIVRRDLMGRAQARIPSISDYQLQYDNGSMLNTPATYNWYLLGLVLDWVRGEGGVKVMEQRSIQKAGLLYAAIDRSGFYHNPVNQPVRSRMNVPFVLADSRLDEVFLQSAEQAGLSALKGHRSVGGMRASLYNAMPLEGVTALTEFMAEFERTHG